MGAMGASTGSTQLFPILPSRFSESSFFADGILGLRNGRSLENVEEAQNLWPEWDEFRTPIQRTAGEKGAPILNLPDDVMTLIFAQLPRRSLASTRAVCSSWKRVSEHQDLVMLRRQMGVTEGWIYVLAESPEESPFQVYDPNSDAWSALPRTPGRIGGGQWQGFACVTLGHKLLLIGGMRINKDSAFKHSSGVVCADVVVYDGLTNKWSRAASMNTPRSWFAAAAIGTKVYVAGGQGNTKFLDSAEVYDSETDTWQVLSSMANRRSSCQGVALDGQFWVISGEYEKNHTDFYQRSSAEVFNAKMNTWRFIPNMCLDDSKVMGPSTVVNGELICVHQRKIMAYDRELNAWKHLGNLKGGEVYTPPSSRFGFACESIGSNLYIIGGKRDYTQNRNRYCTPLNSIEISDLEACAKKNPPQLSWKLGADMSRSQGVMSTSVVVWL